MIGKGSGSVIVWVRVIDGVCAVPQHRRDDDSPNPLRTQHGPDGRVYFAVWAEVVLLPCWCVSGHHVHASSCHTMGLTVKPCQKTMEPLSLHRALWNILHLSLASKLWNPLCSVLGAIVGRRRARRLQSSGRLHVHARLGSSDVHRHGVEAVHDVQCVGREQGDWRPAGGRLDRANRCQRSGVVHPSHRRGSHGVTRYVGARPNWFCCVFSWL